MRRVLLLLLALTSPLEAQEDVQVRARLSATTARVGDTVLLEVTVQTSGAAPDPIRLPDLPAGLVLAGNQEFSSTQIGFPGGRQHKVGRQFAIVADRPGSYSIPAARVQVDGRTYLTDSFELLVGGRASSEGAAGGVDARLTASADPEIAYVGQQVTYTAEMQFSSTATDRLRRSPEYEPPTAPGFWVLDLPDAAAVGTRSIGSTIYDVQRHHRALFPLSPGTFTIPPARVQYEIRRGFISAPERRALQSEPRTVRVLPLPAAGRPAQFGGAVGRYRVRASLAPAEVPAGEVALLTLEVSGVGNVKAVAPPPLPALPGVRVDPPSESADQRSVNGVVQGTKRFSWPLVPERAGSVEIPPIVFAYFDPEQRQYVTDTARVPPLRVGPGAAARDSAPAVLIAGLAAAPQGDSRLGWVRSPIFVAAQLIPLLIVAVLLLRRHRRGSRSIARRAGRTERERRLARLRTMIAAEGSVWLGDLGILLRDAAAGMLQENGLRAASASQLEAVFRRRGIDAALLGEYGALVRRIDHLRYRPEPVGIEERTELIAAAGTLIDHLERAVFGRRSARIGAGAALLIGLSMPGSIAAAEPDASFRSGVATYTAGEYTAAAQAFQAYLRERPNDAAGWQNLGNAYYRAGRSASGQWAWLRALELAPRSSALRRNLRVAGADPWLVRRAAAWHRLTADEVLVLASAAWFVAGGAMAAHVLRAGKTRLAISAGASATAFALAVLGAATAARVDAGVVVGASALRVAPALRADTVIVLAEGAGVEVQSREGAWTYAARPDGVVGWIESTRLAPLPP